MFHINRNPSDLNPALQQETERRAEASLSISRPRCQQAFATSVRPQGVISSEAWLATGLPSSRDDYVKSCLEKVAIRHAKQSMRLSKDEYVRTSVNDAMKNLFDEVKQFPPEEVEAELAIHAAHSWETEMTSRGKAWKSDSNSDAYRLTLAEAENKWSLAASAFMQGHVSEGILRGSELPPKRVDYVSSGLNNAAVQYAEQRLGWSESEYIQRCACDSMNDLPEKLKRFPSPALRTETAKHAALSWEKAAKSHINAWKNDFSAEKYRRTTAEAENRWDLVASVLLQGVVSSEAWRESGLLPNRSDYVKSCQDNAAAVHAEKRMPFSKYDYVQISVNDVMQKLPAGVEQFPSEEIKAKLAENAKGSWEDEARSRIKEWKHESNVDAHRKTTAEAENKWNLAASILSQGVVSGEASLASERLPMRADYVQHCLKQAAIEHAEQRLGWGKDEYVQKCASDSMQDLPEHLKALPPDALRKEFVKQAAQSWQNAAKTYIDGWKRDSSAEAYQLTKTELENRWNQIAVRHVIESAKDGHGEQPQERPPAVTRQFSPTAMETVLRQTFAATTGGTGGVPTEQANIFDSTFGTVDSNQMDGTFVESPGGMQLPTQQTAMPTTQNVPVDATSQAVQTSRPVGKTAASELFFINTDPSQSQTRRATFPRDARSFLMKQNRQKNPWSTSKRKSAEDRRR